MIELPRVPEDDLPEPAAPSSRGLPVPSPRTSLVGRERELAHLNDLLASSDARLVTLAGAGGIGKTRLAIALAHQSPWRDRVAFVALAELRDPAHIPLAIFRTLGLESLPNQPILDVVAASLNDADLLLMLDNLEHLDGSEKVVVALLERCARLRIVATSRIRLNLSGERVIPVEPLALPPIQAAVHRADITGSDAGRLFVERACAATPSFQVTDENAPAIAEICRHLDGLPLAIELAAARSHQYAPHDLATRLRARLVHLDGGPHDAPRRHQTMRAAVAWSVDLLTPAERDLWVRLGACEGGCTVALAEYLGSDLVQHPGEVTAIVDVLVRHGLLRYSTNPLGEPRLAMLEPTREAAADHLNRSPVAGMIHDRHAEFFRLGSRVAEPGLMGVDGETWYERVSADAANLRAAFRHDVATGSIERALETAGNLYYYWTAPERIDEGRLWLDRLLGAAGPEVEPVTRAKALTALSGLENWHNANDASREHALEALALWRQIGDSTQIAATLYTLANTAFDSREIDIADHWLAEAHGLLTASPDPWLSAAVANLRGLVAGERGQYAEEIRWHEVSLRGWEAAGYVSLLPAVRQCLGWAWLAHGGQVEALREFGAILDTPVDTSGDASVAMAIMGIATILHRAGSTGQGVRLLARAMRRREELGLPLRPVVQERTGTIMAEMRGTLGSARFAGAWQEGQALAWPAAIVQAREAIPNLTTALPLSPREREVLALLAEGASDGEVADRLYISRRTASKHVAAILEKLEAPNRTAAVTIALRRGLL